MQHRLQLPAALSVNLIGHSVCGEGWCMGERYLPDMELVVVYSGSLLCTVGEERYELHEGDICIIAPDVPVCQYSQGDGCRFFYVHFEVPQTEAVQHTTSRWDEWMPDAEQSFYHLPGPKPASVQTVLDSPVSLGDKKNEVYALFERALMERTRTEQGWQAMISMYVTQILLLISRRCTEDGGTGNHGAQRKIVQDAVVYLNTHYAEPISMAHLSEQLGVSQQYLARLFKAELGIPPVRYVNRVRVERAEELIRSTALNISEIAAEVGFDSLYYFSRVFHRYTGLSPAQYRKWLDSRSNQ